ncbi:MAG TPA: catalase [Bacillota bacterium]|nr:catalase [Bacillota bacterium]
MLTIGLIEDLARLNRLRQPEPLLFAKGAGAKGVFVPYISMKEYTKACFLQDAETETPVFVRFSRMMGRAGSSDTARDIRGFFVKFFTGEGIYDMPGVNIPVAFIKDPEKYPALLEALSPCTKTNIMEPERLWRFVAENPESMHMITWLYSNRGTIKSYRTMEGHSVHTFVWENDKGESFWVRYHWKPFEGVEEINRQEAEFLAGYDPDAASRDLAGVLERGGSIKYELCVQLISTGQNVESEMSLLDPTVLWPETSVPWTKVGKMILRSGVEDYRAEVENCYFSPGRLIPGIDLSPEPLLIAMTYFSLDHERCRTGNTYMAVDPTFLQQKVSTGGAKIQHYEPNHLITGQLAWRLQSMDEKEKNALIDNMGEEMLFIGENIQRVIVQYLKDANTAVGNSLEKWLGLC